MRLMRVWKISPIPICKGKDKEDAFKILEDTRQLTLVRSLASAKLSFLTDRILSRIIAENLMLIDFFYYCQWLFSVERRGYSIFHRMVMVWSCQMMCVCWGGRRQIMHAFVWCSMVLCWCVCVSSGNDRSHVVYIFLAVGDGVTCRDG